MYLSIYGFMPFWNRRQEESTVRTSLALRLKAVNRSTMDIGGGEPDGWGCNRVVWRRYQCLEYGQWRDDVSHE